MKSGNSSRAQDPEWTYTPSECCLLNPINTSMARQSSLVVSACHIAVPLSNLGGAHHLSFLYRSRSSSLQRGHKRSISLSQQLSSFYSISYNCFFQQSTAKVIPSALRSHQLLNKTIPKHKKRKNLSSKNEDSRTKNCPSENASPQTR